MVRNLGNLVLLGNHKWSSGTAMLEEIGQSLPKHVYNKIVDMQTRVLDYSLHTAVYTLLERSS